MIKEASYYEKCENDIVVCHLCPAECKLGLDKVGLCQCRFNKDGRLMTDNYGEVVTVAVDPIEKKPLYHFYPSTDILSTGANGCNLSCQNCQNWEISQEKVETKTIMPNLLVALAQENNSIGVAFTYTEPFIWFEYILDSAKLLKENDLSVVLVSNGYVNKGPLLELLPYVDAVNVDLKSIQPAFYKKICKGELQPVLETIEIIAKSKIHLELTYLIIPNLNDSAEDVEKWVDYVASISEYIPVHFSAYHPDYKMSLPATDAKTLQKAVEIARKRMKYVFVGNIRNSKDSDSYCPNCSNLLIQRIGYETKVLGLNASHCMKCGIDTKIINN